MRLRSLWLLLPLLAGCPADVLECEINTDCPPGLFCQPDGTCKEPPPGVPQEYCSSCQNDEECVTRVGSGAKCIEIGEGGGTFCAIDCSNAGCPDDNTMVCASIQDNTGALLGRQCVPKSDSCDCTVITPDTQETCFEVNEFGACPGTSTCDPSLGFINCDAPTPGREICDGIDNNCDGVIDGTDLNGDGISDEDPVDVGQPCGSAIPPCSQGVLVCDGGSPRCEGGIPPSSDRCDGVDNDCDGITDGSDLNGDGIQDVGASDNGAPCGDDIGACEPGLALCSPDPGDFDGDGVLAELICQGDVGPIAETCNNEDDDCDTFTDEVEDVGTQTCGVGVCENITSSCETCVPLNNASNEICDGLDNNCNNQTDEGLGSSTCGLGICQNTVFNCIDGTPQNCDPFPPNPTDFPDPAFIDSDCDGIDGELDNAIFVTPVGLDVVGCGSFADPCATIQVGIDEAVAQSKRDVYVAGGNYNGGTFFMADGVNVFGGFGSNFQRDPAFSSGNRIANVTGLESVEISPGEFQAATVVIQNITQPTILADMTLRGASTTQRLTSGQGKSSYTIIVQSAPAGLLRIERNQIIAGNGATGQNGTNGSNAPNVNVTSNMNGVNGQQGDEGSGATDGGGNIKVGSNGGTNNCTGGSATNGGKAGNGGNTGGNFGGGAGPGQVGSTGAQNGAGFGGGGSAGAGSGSGQAGAGGAGQSGRVTNGTAGTKGAAGGLLIANFWYGRDGTSGGVGDNGGGGGGGGGGGASDNNIDDYGSSGGSGGAGGCRAISGGEGGKGGGGSFGVYLINASPLLQQNNFSRGNGSKGGNGGNGGQGQSGGSGGNGGPGFENGGAGGNAGAGGHGGHGGGGGGAGGGISFGVYKTSSASAPTLNGNTFSGGSAGAGGTGGTSAPNAPVSERDGNNGPAGDAGTTGDSGTCANASAC